MPEGIVSYQAMKLAMRTSHYPKRPAKVRILKGILNNKLVDRDN